MFTHMHLQHDGADLSYTLRDGIGGARDGHCSLGRLR